jgi:RHS repeat-associated protein
MTFGEGSAGPHALTTAVRSGGPTHTYTYNAAGDLLMEFDGTTTLNYLDYDPAGGTKYHFNYYGYELHYRNSDGTLVRRLKSTGENIAYIGGIFEKNLQNGDQTYYYHANGKRIAVRKIPAVGSPSLNYITGDHLGSTNVVTAGTTPAIVSETEYYPFGAIESQSTSSPTDRMYTGQLRLTPGEVYDYGSRLYNAYTGRFLKADSIVPEPGSPQALNRYAYVQNNPLRYTDPTGNTPADMDECWHNGELTCGGTATSPITPASLPPCPCLPEDREYASHVAESRVPLVTILGTTCLVAVGEPSPFGEVGCGGAAVVTGLVLGCVAFCDDAASLIGDWFQQTTSVLDDALEGIGNVLTTNSGEAGHYGTFNDAKRAGGIPTSQQPGSQGRYRAPGDSGEATEWWEFDAPGVPGGKLIVVRHPEGHYHVGRPKPQSEHHDGGPPKYYELED